MTTVSFFSAGVSSAVATKLAIGQIDHIIYTHIDDQHPDTLRFVRDCEEWFGKEIEILQSPLRSVENACDTYINGAHGAKCTTRLKRQVRMQWERQRQNEPLRYVWGIDLMEKHRCLGIEKSMPTIEHSFPLVEQGISKAQAHKILTASGINRPAMYDLGYHNNNCVGCVKGGMGYWNKIRDDFPEVFAARARMERRIGATCITEKIIEDGKCIGRRRVYLDELDSERGRHLPPIVADCGIMCEVIGL